MNGQLYQKGQECQKYLFEYYLTTQINSDLNQDQLVEMEEKPILDLETVLVWTNPSNQQKVLPGILSDLQKWVFPNGLNIVNQKNSKYEQLEDFYSNPSSKIGSNVHEINYFVITDLLSLQKYYCTCAFFYEKTILVDKFDIVHEVFIPRSHLIMSMVPFFSAQKSLIGFLLHVHRGKQNMEQDRIINVTKSDLIYGIEQSKLFDYYIQFVFEKCILREKNEKVQLNFHTSERQLTYYTHNDISSTFNQIISSSNTFFDSLIFGQSPYNLLQLITFIILEFQIIIISRRSNSLTLFASNLLELIKPMQWRGVYIPNLISPSIFDFQKSKLPFLIGLHKDTYSAYQKKQSKRAKVPNDEQPLRIVFDVDEGSFVDCHEEEMIKQPKISRNYLMNKIHILVGDIKFYEEDYLDKAVVLYKQYFYNFLLLTFHSMLNFLSKGGEEHSQGQNTNHNSSREAHGTTAASSNHFMKSYNCLSEQIQTIGASSEGSFRLGGVKSQATALAKKDPFQLSKKVVYFNYKAYIASFDEADQPFYAHISKTLIFNGLIKDCFKASDFKEEFIEQERQKQYDYSFGAVICFLEDSKKLISRGRAPIDSVEVIEKIEELEKIQSRQIENLLSVEQHQKRLINTDDGVIEYLEYLYQTSNLNTNIKKDSVTSQGYSSFLSSFLNTPLLDNCNKTPTHKTLMMRKVISGTSSQNCVEFLKEDPQTPFLSKDQFYQQYLDEKKKKMEKLESSQKQQVNQEQFNEDLWEIPTQPNEDIKYDKNRIGLNENNGMMKEQGIPYLSLFEKKNLLENYQKQDYEDIINFKKEKNYEGLSTVIEVQSAFSGFPQKSINQTNNKSRKNSLTEFVKISKNNKIQQEMLFNKSIDSSTEVNVENILGLKDV